MPHFAESGPDDRHFRIDAYAGEVQFGPAVRARRRCAASATAPCRRAARCCGSTSYRTGGGQAGNVARGPGAGAQDERPVRRPGGEPGAGRRRRRGRDPRRRQGARPAAAPLARPGGDRRGLRAAGPRRRARRGPGALRRRGRAAGGRPGAGRAARGQRRRRPDPTATDLDPPAADPGADQHQPRRAPAGRHPAAGPAAGLPVADRGGQPELRGRASTRPRCGPRCCGRCTGCSTRWSAGPDGTGWPFGRSVQSHEVHAALARIPGVDMAREVTRRALPGRGRRPVAAARRCSGSTCPTTGLVYSYEHQVRVSR